MTLYDIIFVGVFIWMINSGAKQFYDSVVDCRAYGLTKMIIGGIMLLSIMMT